MKAHLVNRVFYVVKPFIPREIQIWMRRKVINRKLDEFKDVWPINKSAANPPSWWKGWPEGKQFSFVLTHDVELQGGHDKCLKLMEVEKALGFRSSFNFVPERYNVSSELRKELAGNGFEVGVHGLYHDGKLYKNKRVFLERAKKINSYIKEWDAAGFRSPAMHHNFDWIHELNILYDASSFDTDPFEPQSDGVNTIFPFWITNGNGKSYVELPYTLPQDFTTFILLKEQDCSIWKTKLDWIADNGGMALVNVHPDYINFGDSTKTIEEFSLQIYEDFLIYVKENYKDKFWNPLPKEMAVFVNEIKNNTQK